MGDIELNRFCCLEMTTADYGALTPAVRNQNIELVELVVSLALDVTGAELHNKHRSAASIAFARQVAMYLMHILCSMSFTEIGVFFRRDRTTVAYACQRIEDGREDRQIDWILNLMELSINRLIQYRRGER